MYNILVCDDDHDIAEALRIYLSAEGYGIYIAYDGEEALRLLKEQEIHLVLLDIMMPRLDGIGALVRLRQENHVPVIFLSAKSEDTDKVLGLNLGADDYITKPFNPVEVIARVKSQLRRYMDFGAADKKTGLLSVGGVAMNDASKTVTVNGAPVALTPIEYNILKLLLENAGKVFSSAAIYETVWNDSAFVCEGTVAVHIRHLREKIEINPADPRYLKVVWGQGYKFDNTGKEEKA